jgi:hypothetical protein
MKNDRLAIRRSLLLLASLAVMACGCAIAYAGGPLLMHNGQPVRWPHSEVRGGPLNTQTVDETGRVLYRVDSGPLGPLTNSDAIALVDRIFGLYSNVATADIQFVNAGPILDPLTGNPLDVTMTNAGKVLSSRNPSYQNPIIFDSDGSITGSGGVLGFFGFLQIDFNTNAMNEGFVVLNGAALGGARGLSVPSFLGVFTHEFGHFAGPLDHSQINGNIAMSGEGSILPPGFSSTEAFDLYAPFTETLFPFLFAAPVRSQFRSQFPNSGFFIATLDMDTQNALSNMYPASDYHTSRGSIEGRVLLRFGDTEIPISGINVIARRIDHGAYPPLVGTTAFIASPSIDSVGIPESPPAQDATDSLATVSSAVTGVEFGQGTYRIQGLPPGEYLVQIQQINPDAVAVSGIGPLSNQFPLPVKEEFFNGPGDSSNSAGVFVPVTVSPGEITSEINFTINGISTATPALVSEIEPNESTAQSLTIPVEVSGTSSSTDDAFFRMTFPDGTGDSIEDMYQISLDRTRIVFILLEPTSGVGDLDLYLLKSRIRRTTISLDGPEVLEFSAGATATEMIALELRAGTYTIGVSAFSGSVNYRLRVITSQ